jgi:adenylylsulfate kinase
MIIQFCGLSGSGKTTLANNAKYFFDTKKVNIEIIDGDEYRKLLCADLGFSRKDRITNIRRLAFVAGKLSKYNIIPIICAINPYEQIRQEVANQYSNVKTVYIKCSLQELIRRDTKGMYSKAFLPDYDVNKINNLSGVNDLFEPPIDPNLVIETDDESIFESSQKLINFIEMNR